MSYHVDFAGGRHNALAVVDADGEGDGEVLLAHSNRHVLRGSGGSGLKSIAVGDADRDGVAEV